MYIISGSPHSNFQSKRDPKSIMAYLCYQNLQLEVNSIKNCTKIQVKFTSKQRKILYCPKVQQDLLCHRVNGMRT